MQVVQAPDTILSDKAARVEKVDKTILDLIEAMKVTLVTASDPEGVGIAAPQVGRSLQIFLIKPEKEAPISVFINPEVQLLGTPVQSKSRKNSGAMLEGCLSLKDIWGTVQRYPKVHVTYLDEFGKTHKKVFASWPARIIQHEYDHLQGILFPLRVLEQKGRLYKSHKGSEGKDEFEPMEI
jgi:peptide deformylase